MSTVILTTHGTNGDVLPFLQLAGVLRDRGHDVTLLTHAYYAGAAQQQGIRMIAIDTVAEYERHLADARGALLGQLGSFDQAELAAFYRRNRLLEHVRMEYDTIAERHVPGDTVVVGRHTSGLSALMAAEGLGIPAAWVVLTPAQIGALPVTEFLYANVLAGPINEMRAGAGLGPVRDWAAWLGSADLQLALWPGWFDQVGQGAPAGVRLAGFLLNDEGESAAPPGAAPWPGLPPSATARPPVLVTGTTGQMAHAKFFTAAVDGCLLAGREVVLVTRHRDRLPDPLPAAVHWYPRLPFHDVLPRMAAVVHHGGIGTVARAIAAGVPQLVLGYSYDQPNNGARVARAGLGAWLPAVRWSPAEVAGALGPLLDGACADAVVRRQAELSLGPPAQRACAAIESLLGGRHPAALAGAGATAREGAR